MDIHFNAYKVKFDTMNYFINIPKSSHKINTVTIYINLDNVFHNLHRPLTNNEFQVCGKGAPKQMIANVLNLFGHYKEWAVRNHMHCKIVGFFTTNRRQFKNKIYVAQYRKRYLDLFNPLNTEFYYINDTIVASEQLLKTICSYLMDVYIIDSKYIEPSVIPRYLSREVFKSDWNILISRDSFDYQYAFFDRWSVIIPKGDNSELLTSQSIWDYICRKEKIDFDTRLLPRDISLYILSTSIIGDKYRSIPRIKSIGWKTLFKYIDSVNCENGKVSVKILEEALVNKINTSRRKSKSTSNTEIPLDVLNNNIYAMNIDDQVLAMNSVDESGITSQILDIPDYENLTEINNIHFMDFPINLAFLTAQYNTNKSFNGWK